ncbi:MAG: GNAT family N-acetyltransferase [Actinobacteria bacterium]|nr:GNAT family N-acetyltransferase [Actinomycetota bacterium]
MDEPPYPIRPVGREEFERFFRAGEVAFGSHPIPEEVEADLGVFEADRSLAAFEGDRIVGTAGADSFRLTVPGAEVPAAGVTQVAVPPTHRRRGILTSLMRRQLDDLRDRGDPVAVLWASEAAIYGRFGYGMAALGAGFRVDRGAPFAPGRPVDDGRLRMVELEEALAAYPGPYEAVRRARPGMVDRPGDWWSYRFRDIERFRDGFSALFHVVHESGSEEVDGYLAYRFKHDWGSGGPAGTVRVEELVATSPESHAALWRFALDVDLAATVEARNRPVDDPLPHLLLDRRKARMRVQDSLWVRLVDVPGALAARRYSSSDAVRLRVTDPFCPWNEGTFELRGDPEGAECWPTDGPPDVELDAAALGAAYLGGTGLGALARAGRIREIAPGSLRRAGAMFSWDPAPWCAHVF